MSAPGWLGRWRLRLGEAHRRRRARAELRAMNDLELRDIGLGRSDVPSVLAERFDSQVDAGQDPRTRSSRLR